MQARICEKCGTRFWWRQAGEGVAGRTIGALAAWIGITLAFREAGDRLGHIDIGFWAGFLLGMAAFSGIASGGKRTHRKCPSCGSPGVDRESPLGKELQLRWKDVHAEATRKATEKLFHVLDEYIPSLIDEGADVNTKDSLGATPLCYRASQGGRAGVYALLRAGARADVADKEGRTPLMWAAYLNRLAVVKLLLGDRTEVNAKDATGATALMWAARSSRQARKKVRALLDAGANVKVKDANGDTALDYALRAKNADVVRVLIEAGAEARGATTVPAGVPSSAGE